MIVPYELTDKMKVCKLNSNIRVTRYVENAPSKIQTNVQENLLVIVMNGRKKLVCGEYTTVISKGEFGFFKKENYIMNQILTDDNYESLLVFIPDEYIREIRNFNKKEFIYDRGLKNIPYIQGCIGENLQYEVNDLSKYMEQNYEVCQDISSIADRLNMSISTFKRKFVNTYGETPGKWINNKKIQKAIGLLNTTDYLITDICFLCGFESISTFNVQFKKNFGMTPTQFSRKINL